MMAGPLDHMTQIGEAMETSPHLCHHGGKANHSLMSCPLQPQVYNCTDLHYHPAVEVAGQGAEAGVLDSWAITVISLVVCSRIVPAPLTVFGLLSGPLFRRHRMGI